MAEPKICTLKIGLSKLVLTLTDDRFTSKGPMANSDIPLADLQHFCLVPVPSAYGYDAQFVLSWMQDGKLKNKKLTLAASDPLFQDFLAALTARCPNASLVHLDATQALKQMGVGSFANTANKIEDFAEKVKKWTFIVIGGVIAIIVLFCLIFWVIAKFKS